MTPVAPQTFRLEALFGLVLTAVTLAGLAILDRSAGLMTLDGRALLAAGGDAPFASFVTAFPPLPYLLTTTVAWLGQDMWAASPVTPAQIVSALLAGAIAASWLGSLREAFPALATRALVLTLLVINPLFLTAFAAGPETMLTILGFWWLTIGLFELRRNAVAGDAISIAVGLLVIGFSSPYGLVFALAAAPALALATPPDLLARSALGSLVSILFPLVAAVLGYMFIAYIFVGAPMKGLMAILDHSTDPSAGEPIASFAFAVLGLGVCAPIAPVLAWRGAHRLQILLPVIATMAIAVTGFTLARTLGHAAAPLTGLAPLIALSAVAAARWPTSEVRRTLVITALLAAGAIGALVLALTLQAAGPHGADVSSDKALGQFLRGKEDVLIDAEAAPAVIAARGGSAGLVGPTEPRFGMVLLTHRPKARYLVLSGPERGLNDRLARGLFSYAQAGAPGYRLIYDNNGWRVFERECAAQGNNRCD